MQHYPLLLLQILTTDFFMGYGLYSLLLLLVIVFVKKPWIRKLDERYEQVYRNVLLRIAISLVLLVSIERFIILTTALHRDYLPNSWTMYNQISFDPDYLLLGVLLKTTLFVAFTGIYYVLKIRFTELIYRNPVKRIRP